MSEIVIKIDGHIFSSLANVLKKEDDLIALMEPISTNIYSVMPTDHCCPAKPMFLEADHIYKEMMRVKAERDTLLHHIIKTILKVNPEKIKQEVRDILRNGNGITKEGSDDL